uniref:Disintegrin and metalloproteinase domain-containing protein 2 n=1 Tax=Sciurus vulgaris TaxID=55149 RepID=A0A8D2AK33_SCIVU
MLRVLLLLGGLGGLRVGHNYERLHVQVTVPVKIRSIKTGGFESHVSYNITIEGKTYTMNLTQKIFLPHNFKVYGYDGAGIMKPLDKEFQNFCYYQGFIEGYPNSMVIVSACTGLRGLLQFQNISYGIEPLESSVGFEHVIYQVKYKNATSSVYTEKDIELRSLPYKIQSIEHPRTIGLESLAIILAQLLSLNMGIAYDDVDKCHCPGTICIMNPEAIHSSGVKTFSNCSMEDFAHFLSKQKSLCLQNQPRLEPSYKQAAVCGNRKVEEGESCDCGNEQECAENTPVCCDHSTCAFTEGSQCASGPCCVECKFAQKGHVCRSSSNECDLIEYCNGTSSECQGNFYIIDGHPCGDSQWICIQGKCVSGSRQCTEVFGEGSEYGSEECFQELNSRTDISGNCGITDAGYKECAANGHICVSLEYTQAHSDTNAMWVKDGTVCGPSKVCQAKECVDDTYLNYDCKPETCNNKGVCNNQKHCHCNTHYVPPNCQEREETSVGGSIDSGNHEAPAAPTERRYIERTYYESKTSRWPFFLLIPFFVIFCVLIAMLVKVHFQRKKWKSEDYTSD